jgi:hypothetical protein
MVMPRSHVIASAALFAVFGCSAAIAGDFVSRATSAYTVGDSAGARGSCAEGASQPMSESDAAAPASAAGAAALHAGPASTAKHYGVDDGVADVRPAVAPADIDDKAVPNPHKAHTLRWQSLLPGVMK